MRELPSSKQPHHPLGIRSHTYRISPVPWKGIRCFLNLTWFTSIIWSGCMTKTVQKQLSRPLWDFFEFRRMPSGLRNAAQTFQRFMDTKGVSVPPQYAGRLASFRDIAIRCDVPDISLSTCRPRDLTVVTDARAVLRQMTRSVTGPAPRGEMNIRLVFFSLRRHPISPNHSARRDTASDKSLATTAGLQRQ